MKGSLQVEHLPVHRALCQAQNSTLAYLNTLLWAMAQEWQDRRALKKLQSYPDWALHDVGIKREQLMDVLRLPLTVDAAQALGADWRA